MVSNQQYDVIVVGTGFASSFFLHAYLKKAKPTERILVLERGFLDTHAWQVENEKTSSIDHRDTFKNKNPEWAWTFNVGFGGGSNCWWGNTPRMLPSDFEMKTRYGVGRDWPMSYDELEPFYLEVERLMAISGPPDDYLHPRSASYPQAAHRFTSPDTFLKQAYPDSFFNMPTARARVPTENRPRCCATGVCNLCPIDAKFTVQNEMQAIYSDPRITIELRATVDVVDVAGGTARGVTYTQDGSTKQAHGDLIVLGANGIFNPHILLRSGLSHSLLGKLLNEQPQVIVIADLAGIDNYQGSTSHTGLGFMNYDVADRSEHAAFLVETNNSPQIDNALRAERGKWLKRLILHLVFEDIPSERNYVGLEKDDPDLPAVYYEGHSDYTQRSIDALPEIVPRMLQPLPIERFTIGEPETSRHIQGTVVMGEERESSIVDRYLVHHDIRNLLVLGSSAFPTCPTANPTLTLSALSLWAAEHLR